MNRTVIGIDVGGTTTKIVGFRENEKGEKELIAPQFVRATDPLTSIYGAFGKFTSENGLELGDIDRILMTGAGSSTVFSAERLLTTSTTTSTTTYVSADNEKIIETIM